jgi:hypothetical protein
MLTALFLGWAVDLLFYGKPVGISALLFVLLLLVALFGLGRLKGIRPSYRNLWLAAPLLFFAGMLAVRANGFLTFSNSVATLSLLAFVAHFYTGGQVSALGLTGYPAVLLQVGGQALLQAAPLLPGTVDLGALKVRGRRHFFPVMRGVLLATPLLFTFTLLLASADLVFATYVQYLFSWSVIFQMFELSWRAVLIGVQAWLLAGALAYTLLRSRGDEPAWLPRGLLTDYVSLGVIEALTILALIDLLFLTFVWIQFAYLFGGSANVHIAGFTYAEYARRGFFELVAVAVMTLGLILGLHGIVQRATSRARLLFNGLSSLMVALVMVLLVSALQRLRLYEMVFGYTHLRLHVHLFIIWLRLLLAWFLLTLWLPGRTAVANGLARLVIDDNPYGRFAIGAFIAALGFLISLNLLNPDEFIARQNLARFQATGNLDVYYLSTLSDDAVPLMISVLPQLEQDERWWLCYRLHSGFSELQQGQDWRRWPAFHWSRERAYAALADGRWQPYCPQQEQLLDREPALRQVERASLSR